MAKRGHIVGVELENFDDFAKMIKRLPKDLQADQRKGAQEDGQRILIPAVKSHARMSGIPQAPRIADAAKARRDRLGAKVEIKGGRKVFSGGATVSDIVMGADHGGRNFTRPPSSSYWAEPARDFAAPKIISRQTKRLYQLVKKTGWS